MLLSSLQTMALNWSQFLTDFVYKYGPPLSWDPVTQTFRLESRPRRVYCWLFINYGIVGALQFLGSGIFFANVLSTLHLAYESTLKIVFAIGITAMSTATLFTCISYRLWFQELYEFYNKILIFEFSLWIRYSSGPTRVLATVTNSRLKTWRLRMESIRLPTGELDLLGVFSIFLVVGFSIIPPFLPWIGIWMNVDIPFATIQRLLDTYEELKLFAVSFRVACTCLLTAEICNCFRFLSAIAILGFRSLESCQSLLLTQSIGDAVLGELNQFRILFSFVRNWMAFLFCTFLALVFVLLMACVTGLVIMVNTAPWYLQFFIALIALITASIITIILYLVISIDQKSSALYQSWMLSLSQHPCNLKRRQLYKILKSIQPVRIPYGTLGTFKKATRTDFFSSLIVHSLNCILTFAN